MEPAEGDGRHLTISGISEARIVVMDSNGELLTWVKNNGCFSMT